MRARPFFMGLFLLCMSILLTQIVQTRLLSVMGRYYLAFFSISMAMFGMTAGALRVYFRGKRYGGEALAAQLASISLFYAFALLICTGFELASVATVLLTATDIFIWLKMILLMVPPFFFGGMAVSLALTRSPFRIGLVYGVDLLGAAGGCVAAIGLLDVLDGPSAIIAIAAIVALAATCFALADRGGTTRNPGEVLPRVTVVQAGLFTLLLGILAVLNASTPFGFRLIASKDHIEHPEDFAFEQWNSFSRIAASHVIVTAPYMVGASPITPKDLSAAQISVDIDGDASTTMMQFSGDRAALDFLRYDITTLAYTLRDHGRAAIIGVGGGRDILSAYGAGFRDITGVELNPIFVDLLTRREPFADFAGIAHLPGVRFFVDDGRSWFARTTEHFDLIQMSLVDTWASTGAGGFTLSENGLYTVEGWGHFLHALSPTGVFTVSRWYAPGFEYETGRLVSLALTALRERGVADPRAHVFLASQQRLATIIVSAAPFSPAELARLHAAADHYRHTILASPDQAPGNGILGSLLSAESTRMLMARASAQVLDVSPATDARPFFFNMLRLDPWRFVQAVRMAGQSRAGVVRGNLMATGTLFLIIVLSATLVAATVVLPMRETVRAVDRRLAIVGTCYFALIGLGFMLVEIGVIQRISVFLGHPVYALSVGLFGIILATGIGSFASDYLSIATRPRFAAWAIMLAGYIALFPQWFPAVAASAESAPIGWRALICVVAIGPAGVLMGFGFPTGMRLVNNADPRPTPWFWGINGAAGVLGSGIAVACSVSTSIGTTLRVGALCYLLLAIAGLKLVPRRG